MGFPSLNSFPKGKIELNRREVNNIWENPTIIGGSKTPNATTRNGLFGILNFENRTENSCYSTRVRLNSSKSQGTL